MLKRVVLAGLAFAAIFLLGLLAGVISYRILPFAFTRSFSSPAILTRVQTLSQLVTVKYVLEKVVNYEDAKWYGENRVLLVAHGVAKAGIDLGRITPADISISDKSITLTLPRPTLTDVYLDEDRTEIIERSTGIMRVFDKNLEQGARRQAIDDLRHAAMQNGILKDADERARAQLALLLQQLGFTEVEFKTR